MKRLFIQLITSIVRSAFLVAVLLVPVCHSLASETFSPQEVAERVNQDRVAAGLPALRLDQTLSVAAEAKAQDMATKEYFAHTAPDGTTPWYFFEKAGYSYRYAGENLAIHFTDVEDEESAWMASEKHRENILSPKYVETGIAVAEIPWKGKTTLLTVELFGTRFGETVADTSPWKSLDGVSPTVSGVSASRERSVSAGQRVTKLSLAGHNVMPVALSQAEDTSVVASFPSLFGISMRTLVIATLICIGCLEVIAASIVFRLLLRRDRLNVSHNATPM